MKKRHQLKLVGITYNQIESGVYAVILEEINGSRRIPIVIGYPEAQAIECFLQKVRTPRPLTHDLMKSILETFNLRLSCIDIKKLPSGVFSADLVMEGPDGELHKIDSRSSDALALAIRTGSPIYTSSDVLEECGISPEGRSRSSQPTVADNKSSSDHMASDKTLSKDFEIESFENLDEVMGDESRSSELSDEAILEFLSNYTDKEIENQISKFASEEKYEVAAKLKNLLLQRKDQH